MRFIFGFLIAISALAQAIPPAVFPGAVAGPAQMGIAVNRIQTVLQYTIGIGDTSMTVVSTAGIVPDVIVTIDAEEMWVCGVSGKIVQFGRSACPNIDGRAVDGSTVKAHNAGAYVTAGSYLSGGVAAFPVSWLLNSQQAEITAIETSLSTFLPPVPSSATGFPLLSVLSGAPTWGGTTFLGVPADITAASAYLVAIYPFGVTTATMQAKDFTGAGVSQRTYNGLTALSFSDMPDGNVVGGWLGSVCRATTATCFGANVLALSNGSSNPRVVGMEIDVEPAAGVTTQGGSAGLYINGFNSPIQGAAIGIGAINGGLFNNGISISGIATAGAALFVPGGATSMASFINTTQATFSGDAIYLGNGQGISIANTGSGFARIWNDSSNNVRLVPGTSGNIVVRNAADTSSTGNLVTGTMQLTGAGQPTCSAVASVGAFWYSGHANGVKDSVAVCAGDPANAFAWRTIY